MVRNKFRTLLVFTWLCLFFTVFQEVFCKGDDLDPAALKLKNGTITFFSDLEPMCYSVDNKGKVTVKFGTGNSAITFTDVTLDRRKTKIGTEFIISIREKIANPEEVAASEKKIQRTADGKFTATLDKVTFISGHDNLVYKDARGKHAIPMCK